MIHICGRGFQCIFNEYKAIIINGCPNSGPEKICYFPAHAHLIQILSSCRSSCFQRNHQLDSETPDPKEPPNTSIIFTFSQIFSSVLSTGPYQHPSYSGGSGGHGQDSISCFRCGGVCKGEVVRVQNVHFHVKCFTCQGMKIYSSFTKS